MCHGSPALAITSKETFLLNTSDIKGTLLFLSFCIEGCTVFGPNSKKAHRGCGRVGIKIINTMLRIRAEALCLELKRLPAKESRCSNSSRVQRFVKVLFHDVSYDRGFDV